MQHNAAKCSTMQHVNMVSGHTFKGEAAQVLAAAAKAEGWGCRWLTKAQADRAGLTLAPGARATRAKMGEWVCSFYNADQLEASAPVAIKPKPTAKTEIPQLSLFGEGLLPCLVA